MSGFLLGKTALVAGVGPGLGRQTCELLVREGASIVIGARNVEYLDLLRSELTLSPEQRVHVGRLDLGDSSSCTDFVASAKEALGGVDILVCTGRAADTFALFADVQLDTWRTIMEVNLYGPLALAQACIPSMQARGGGSMVFVSSLITRRYKPRQGGYAVSKTALASAGRVLATELGSYNIRVNTLVPGWMTGPTVDDYLARSARLNGTSSAEEAAVVESRIPIGRIPSDRECAESILYLVSPMASAVTGQSLDVNGGEYQH